MLWFFARSGRRHPLLPVALGLLARRQPLEPRRPDPARLRDRLPRPRLLAGVQPRGHVHRRRGRRSCSSRSSPPTASSPRVGSLRSRVPDDGAGLAARRRGSPASTGVGSRAVAERLIADGRVLVDGAAASRRAIGSRAGRSVDVELPRAADARAGGRRPRRSCTPTSTCSWSTSRPGVVTHPGGGPRDRHARARARSRSAPAGGDERPAGDRPPARPRHVGAAGRRALGDARTTGCSDMIREREVERRYLALVVGAAALAQRPDRRADRPRPRPTRRATRSTPTRRARR